MKKQIAVIFSLVMLLSLIVTAFAQGETNTGFTVTTETNESGNTVTSITDSDGVTFTVEEVEDFADEVVVNDEEEDEVGDQNSIDDASSNESENIPGGEQQKTVTTGNLNDEPQLTEESVSRDKCPIWIIIVIIATVLIMIAAAVLLRKRKSKVTV